MEPDFLFDQVPVIFHDFIDQHEFRITRKEKANEFDFRLMILESPQIKLRFTLDRSIVDLAVGILDAPNDWSSEVWFSLDVLLAYLAEKRKPRLQAIIDRLVPNRTGDHHQSDYGRSTIFETTGEIKTISSQLDALKGALLASYGEVVALLHRQEYRSIIAQLQRFRDRGC
jgi:hypothetical protein